MANKRLDIIFGADTRALLRGIGTTKAALATVGKWGGLVASTAAAAATVAAAAWAKAVTSVAAYGDAVGKMAKRTGLGTDSVQRLTMAAELSGASIDDVEKGVKRMASTVLDAERGLKTSTDTLDALGLSLADLKGRSPEAQFEAFMAALAGIPDASTRAALAQDVFGRSGTALLPMLADGADGLRTLMHEADNLDLIMPPEQVRAAEDFVDALGRIRARAGALARAAVGRGLAPLAAALNDVATNRDVFTALAGPMGTASDGMVRFVNAVLEMTKDKEFMADLTAFASGVGDGFAYAADEAAELLQYLKPVMEFLAETQSRLGEMLAARVEKKMQAESEFAGSEIDTEQRAAAHRLRARGITATGSDYNAQLKAEMQAGRDAGIANIGIAEQAAAIADMQSRGVNFQTFDTESLLGEIRRTNELLSTRLPGAVAI